MLSKVFRPYIRGNSNHLYLGCTLKNVRHISRSTVSPTQPQLQHRILDGKIKAVDFSGQYRYGLKRLKHLEFKEKMVISLNCDFPVIVNFHAEWCEPCHETVDLINSVVDESEYVCAVTLMIDENPEIVHHLGIKAVPTLIAYQEGTRIDKIVGAVTEEEIRQLVNKLDNDFRRNQIVK